jgi:Ca2+-binding RTX toxin-like protein
MVASYSTTYKGEYNLGSGGDDIINGGDGTDVCIGGQGENTFSNCETMH